MRRIRWWALIYAAFVVPTTGAAPECHDPDGGLDLKNAEATGKEFMGAAQGVGPAPIVNRLTA